MLGSYIFGVRIPQLKPLALNTPSNPLGIPITSSLHIHIHHTQEAGNRGTMLQSAVPRLC